MSFFQSALPHSDSGPRVPAVPAAADPLEILRKHFSVQRAQNGVCVGWVHYSPFAYRLSRPLHDALRRRELGSFIELETVRRELSQLRQLRYWPSTEPPHTVSFRPSGTVGRLGLAVVNECNLHCTYCTVDRGHLGNPRGGAQNGRMSPQTARAALELTPQLFAKRNIAISFFGGEPLLNWPALESAFIYAQQHLELNFNFSLGTNGTLLTDSRLKRLRECGCRIQVSLDGPAVIHDRNRPGRGGQGTFSRVRKAVGRLKEMEFDFLVQATVTEPAEWSKIEHFFTEELKLQSHQFRINDAWKTDFFVLRGGNGQGGAAAPEPPPVEHARDSLRLWGKEQAGALFRCMPLSFYQRVYYSNWAEASICGAGSHALVVSPPGDLYPCPIDAGCGRFAPAVGNVHRPFQRKKFLEQLEQWIAPFNECQRCGLRGLCPEHCTLGFHTRRARAGNPPPDSFKYCDTRAMEVVLGGMLAQVAGWRLSEFNERLCVGLMGTLKGYEIDPTWDHAAQLAWQMFREHFKHIVPLNFLSMKNEAAGA